MKKTFTLLLAFLLLMAINLKASVIYTPMNLTADQSSTWLWFEWGPDADGFGLWVVPGSSLRIETYTDAVIGYDDAGMTFLNPVPYETEIGPASDWINPTAASYLNDETHAALNGTVFYAGFQLRSATEDIYYGWMQLEVAEDGLSFTLIDMAYEDTPGTPLPAGVVDRQIMYDTEIFTEDLLTNDGHIMNQAAIELLGASFALSSGTLEENTHYTVDNLPAGLDLSITLSDANNAAIALNGQATNNDIADTVNNLSIYFLDAAFDGVPAADITNAAKSDLFIKFFGIYELVYEDLPDPVCATGGWVPFQNAYFENYFGIWHDGTDMRLETYGKDVVGEVIGDNSFVTPLEFDSPINEESTWVPSGVWPAESYLTHVSYSEWLGQDKYAGIKLVLGDAIMYGWVHLGVSDDGTEITVLDWAFNTNPNTQIKAGQTDNTGFIMSEYNSINLYPNPCFDKVMIELNEINGNGEVQVLDLLGNVIFSNDFMMEGSEKLEYDMSDKAPGLYLLRIRDGQNSLVKKFIKAR